MQRSPGPLAAEETELEVVVDSDGSLLYDGDAGEALGVERRRHVRLAVRVLEVTDVPADELDGAVIRRA